MTRALVLLVLLAGCDCGAYHEPSVDAGDVADVVDAGALFPAGIVCQRLQLARDHRGAMLSCSPATYECGAADPERCTESSMRACELQLGAAADCEALQASCPLECE